MPATFRVSHSPRPWLAVLFTLWLPGLGQAYALAPWRGLVVLLGFYALAGLAAGFALGTRVGFIGTALSILGWLAWAAVDAGRLARAGRDRRAPWWFRWPALLAAGVVVNLILGWGFPKFVLDKARFRMMTQASANMEPTLKPGQRVAVDTGCYHLKPLRRGEVVVVESPEDCLLWVLERCVAVAGDQVEIRDQTFYLNGVAQASWPVAEWLPRGVSERKLVLPPGTLFCLGDNLGNSLDSRTWGPLSVSAVQGRALYGVKATGLVSLNLPPAGQPVPEGMTR